MASVLVVRGSTFQITGVVYSTGTTPADLTGATIKCYVKNRSEDTDGAAVITKTGSITVALSGTYSVSFSASDTNALDYRSYFVEVIAKLADSSFIRNGENYFVVTQNVMRTLF